MAEGAIGVVGGEDLNHFLRRLRTVNVAELSNGSGSATLRPLVEPPQLPKRLDALSTLTSSERRVLCAMMQGWSASDIADSLVVALSTVRTHIRSILAKLGVSSQIAAVAVGYGVDPR
jgi:DNA-binding NarL/FixJ family response regulator